MCTPTTLSLNSLCKTCKIERYIKIFYLKMSWTPEVKGLYKLYTFLLSLWDWTLTAKHTCRQRDNCDVRNCMSAYHMHWCWFCYIYRPTTQCTEEETYKCNLLLELCLCLVIIKSCNIKFIHKKKIWQLWIHIYD